MPAKEFTCKVVSAEWLTPSVVDLRFEPSRKFRFEPGQFVSVVVPPPPGSPKPLRRAYSLAIPPEDGFGLCVRVVPNGPGSNYISNLRVGDTFKIFAPYGEFLYDHNSSRNVCFVSTGTGLAPFISMMRSKHFQNNLPPRAINLFGARDSREIILPGHFEKLGVEEVHALSEPLPNDKGYFGRVTDWLQNQGPNWAWQTTDFYLCGNGLMVADVVNLLKQKGVPENHVHKEIYFVAPDRRIITPPPMRHAVKKAA